MVCFAVKDLLYGEISSFVTDLVSILGDQKCEVYVP